MQGKTSKQHLEQWLRNNAHEYGVTNAKQSKKFAELASIPNWDITGGKAKSIPTPLEMSKEQKSKQQVDEATVHQKIKAYLPASMPDDDDIPF